MNATRRYTTADLEAMPYDEWHRYEIIDGELHVTPPGSYWHQITAGKVCYALMDWCDETELGWSVMAPGVIFALDNAVVPDVVWVSRSRLWPSLDADGHFTSAPEILAEVLAPGDDNQRRDCELKLRIYSRFGVEEYWIVDWLEKRVQVYRPSNRTLVLSTTLRGDDCLESPLLPGFSIPISRLWPPERLMGAFGEQP